MPFLLKRRQDTDTNWQAINPVVPDRQLAFTKDAGGTGIPLLKIGNGSDNWADLPYINKRNNQTTTNPTVSNNATEFYSVGSEWVNTTALTKFVLTSFSGSDAIWTPIGGLIANLQEIQDVPDYPDDGYEYVLTELDGVLSWELPSGGSGAVDSVNGQTGVVVLDLADLDDVPPYPNDGYDYVLVENNEVLTWELYSSGGGTVDSVTGDSVDNTDPDNPIVNAIPLSGTEVGSPVTGAIQVKDDFYNAIYQENSDDGDVTNSILFQQDAGIALAVEVSGGASSYIAVDRLQVNIICSDASSQGLVGQSYFGANYNDNTYVQKKYVDDNFEPIGGGIPTIGSSTDNAIVRWNGAGGTAVQDSGVTIDDSDNLSGVNNRTGNDADFVSGTAGTSGNLLEWDANGDAVDSGIDSADVLTAIPDEEDIVGTAAYNGTMTGTVNLDLSTFSSFYGILTGNTTITVSNTPASGESFVRTLKLSSTATEALTLPVAWKVIGTYSADTTVNDFQLEFSNFPTQGLVVSVYINQLP